LCRGAAALRRSIDTNSKASREEEVEEKERKAAN